ncbi:MAG: PEP/pyruvate-binding domain-containing protein, partial [Paracoccaceae bacterium]
SVDGCATRLGYDLEQDWADAEFVGMVRFSPAAYAQLSQAAQTPGILRSRAGLSKALEYLRARGQTIHTVDTKGQWVEVIETRDIAEFVLGTKADTLQRLRSVLERGTIQEVRAFTVADWMADADAVLAGVRAQFQGKVPSLVVRSSARSEDTFHSSNAGGYDSVLNVDPETGLQAAITQVIGSYGSAEPDDQVLVQPMLEGVRLSGVAFTRTSEHYAPYYVINYDRTGSTDGVTAGTSSDHLTLFVQRDADLDMIPDAELRPVVHAIREIEDRLGYDTLDIEFAVDTAGAVHVFQVRPIAIKAQATPLEDAAFHAARAQAVATWDRLSAPAPHVPGTPDPIYSVMTDWNPAEIIGTAPGRLAETLYRFLIMDNTWAKQRYEYGYRDLRPQPLLVSMAGRPYVDVRASLSSFIPAALDDDLAGRLLASYIRRLAATPALHDKVEFDIVPTCLAPNFQSWATRLTTEDGFPDHDVAALRAALADLTKAAFHRCQGDLDQLKTLEAKHAAIQAAVLDPLERARLLLHSCRTDGALPFSHLARSGFVAVTLLREAEAIGALSPEARASFM